MTNGVILETGFDDEFGRRFGERSEKVFTLAKTVVDLLTEQGLYITTVESCTGGGFAHHITCVPGASDILKDSFVTYSTEAKVALGVPAEIIEKHTVYSTETALAMAHAGLERSVRADIAIGITGSLSRVDPANSNSVPGEVYLGIVHKGGEESEKLLISEPNRPEAKLHIIEHGLQAIHHILTPRQ